MAENVINLAPFLKEKSDDAGFLACLNCKREEWLVVCRKGVMNEPFVASIICASCGPGQEIILANGYLDGAP